MQPGFEYWENQGRTTPMTREGLMKAMKEEISKLPYRGNLKEARKNHDEEAVSEILLFQNNWKEGNLKFYPGIQKGSATLYDAEPLITTIERLPAAAAREEEEAEEEEGPEPLTSSHEEFIQQERKRRMEEAGLSPGFKLKTLPKLKKVNIEESE